MSGTRSNDAAGGPGADHGAEAPVPLDPPVSLDGPVRSGPGSDEVDEAAAPGVGDLGSFIREQRRRGRLSLRKLSELSGISNPYLSQIERGLRKPSAEILQQVARALHVSVESLYVRAGILEPTVEGPTVAEAVAADPELDDEQKRALLHIYESFRRAHRVDPTAVATGGRASKRPAGPRTDRRTA